MSRKNRQIKHTKIIFKNNCILKRKYLNEKQALEAADYQMLINPYLELSVYRCEICGMWHLTRQKTD